MSNPGPEPRYPIESWMMAKALFLAGFPIAKCARESHIPQTAVYKRAEREEWNALRLHVSEVQALHKQELKTDAHLGAMSEKLKSLVAIDLERSIMNLKRCRHAATVEGIGTRAQVQATLIKNASDLFGWRAQATTTTVNIALLSGKSYTSHDKQTGKAKSLADRDTPTIVQAMAEQEANVVQCEPESPQVDSVDVEACTIKESLPSQPSAHEPG